MTDLKKELLELEAEARGIRNVDFLHVVIMDLIMKMVDLVDIVEKLKAKKGETSLGASAIGYPEACPKCGVCCGWMEVMPPRCAKCGYVDRSGDD